MNMARHEKISTIGINNEIVDSTLFITDIFGNVHKKYYDNYNDNSELIISYILDILNHEGTMYRLLAKEIPYILNNGRTCIRKRCKGLRNIEINLDASVISEHDMIVFNLELKGFTKGQTNELINNWDYFINMHHLLRFGKVIHKENVDFKSSVREHCVVEYILKFDKGIM